MAIKAIGRSPSSQQIKLNKSKKEHSVKSSDSELLKLMSQLRKENEEAIHSQQFQMRNNQETLFTHFTKELSNAAQKQDIDAIESLLIESYANQIDMPSLVDAVIARFGRKNETSERCKNLELITKTALVKIGILNSDPQVFQSPLATKLKLQNESQKNLVHVINTMIKEAPTLDKKNFLMRLKAEIESVYQIDHKRHNLQPLEILTLCLKVEKVFESHVPGNGTLYLRRSQELLPRSVVINFNTHTFTILSKKYGALQAHGTFKRVTDAIQVLPQETTATAKRMVRAVNKFEKEIRLRELQFEIKYGEIDTIISYPAKRDSSVTKTNLIQDYYDSDLYIFTGNTPRRARKQLSINEIITVIEEVGNKLALMHSVGDVHRDLKAKNVLFRRNPNGTISTKICDFGHTTTPLNEMVSDQEYRTHGTLRYSPPEVLKSSPENFNPFEQQKAIDMFGLGNMLYELITHKRTSWGHEMYVALKKYGKGSSRASKKALELQKAVYRSLKEENRPPHTSVKKELLYITAKLLNPDPKNRMQIEEFQVALKALKKKI